MALRLRVRGFNLGALRVSSIGPCGLNLYALFDNRPLPSVSMKNYSVNRDIQTLQEP